MPRSAKKDREGFPQSEAYRKSAGTQLQSPPPPMVPEPPSPLHQTAPTTATAALASLVFRSDGRYSVNAHEAGHAYHKWRWSAGPLSGRYVMFVASRWMSLDDGMLGLVDKVLGAEEGRVATTLDRYH